MAVVLAPKRCLTYLHIFRDSGQFVALESQKPSSDQTAEVEKTLHLAEVGLCSVAGLLHDGPGISDRLLPFIDTKMIFATSSHKGGVTLICIKFVENF